MNLKQIRKRLHLSQAEFAEICQISRVYLSNLENDKVDNPGSKTLENIKQSIIEYIFFGKDVKNTKQE